MPRSKDPSRYPRSYFDALHLAQRHGQHSIPCSTKATAESLRLNFSSLRAGILERNFTPYSHFAPGFKFLVRLDPPRLLITWGGSDDLSQLVEMSLPRQPSAFIASHVVEHTQRQELPSQDMGALMASIPDEEADRKVREKLGLPPLTGQEDTRSPDQLISDLLKLKGPQ